jgi:uncharacterized protein
MILYRKTAGNFLADVDNNTLVEEIERAFIQQIGWVPPREIDSWNHSLRCMESIVRKSDVSKDCGILIEYKIPPTSKRIDFLIAGNDDEGNRNLVIVELKGWKSAKSTTMDGVVVTDYYGRPQKTTHPAYQAYSYKSLLTDFNENIETKRIAPYSCAYLHNYIKAYPEPLCDKIYEKMVADSPLFFQHDTEKLQQFIRKYVGRGKGMETLYEIEKGRIRPSKKLIDHVNGMFEGNSAFTLIDNQKVAFEVALDIAQHATKKTVVVIRGGPGTGKSVISVNLLGALLKLERNVLFVAPNAAFRDVMVKSLARDNQVMRLRNLFKGSSSFVQTTANEYDVMIVDEAHRLKNASAYMYTGENQVEDVVKASLITILFIDELQQVRPDDIGTVEEIRRVAKKFGAQVQEMELDAQYRCAGAEGFVNWLDTVLQIRETGNANGWDRKEFDFRIVASPNELRKLIRTKQNEGLSARMLAGYAWPWTSEGNGNPNGEIADVVITEHHFKMPWNSRQARSTWAIDSSGIDQIGCIHTSQGLEFDYVGVIIGLDLQFDPGKNAYRSSWEDYKDTAGRNGLRDKPDELCHYIKNIYKTLMSRAMKGCYVYICHPEVAKHFQDSLRATEDHYSGAESR